MIRNFTLEYWKDNDWFVGKLKEIPGIFSQGESLNELELNIKDAFYLMLKDEEEILVNKVFSRKEIEVEI